MNRKTIALAALAAITSGCAKAPDSIAPAYVSELTYMNWQCEHMAEETHRLNAALARASEQQEKARTNDITGVILIGLPVSSLSGDNIAPEIARLKGEQEAIRKAMITKGCASSSQPTPENLASQASTKATP